MKSTTSKSLLKAQNQDKPPPFDCQPNVASQGRFYSLFLKDFRARCKHRFKDRFKDRFKHRFKDRFKDRLKDRFKDRLKDRLKDRFKDRFKDRIKEMMPCFKQDSIGDKSYYFQDKFYSIQDYFYYCSNGSMGFGLGLLGRFFSEKGRTMLPFSEWRMAASQIIFSWDTFSGFAFLWIDITW